MAEYCGDNQLLKIVEVAAVLKVSRSQIYRLIAQGDLPHVRFGEETIRVRVGDLNRYIESKVMTPPRSSPNHL